MDSTISAGMPASLLRASHAADLPVTPARSGFHGYFRALRACPEVSSLAPAMFLQMSLPGPGASPFSGMLRPAPSAAKAFRSTGSRSWPTAFSTRRTLARSWSTNNWRTGTPAPRRHAAPDRVPAAGPQPRHRPRGAAGVPGVGDRGLRRPDRVSRQGTPAAVAAAEPGVRPHRHPAAWLADRARWGPGLRGARPGPTGRGPTPW